MCHGPDACLGGRDTNEDRHRETPSGLLSEPCARLLAVERSRAIVARARIIATAEANEECEGGACRR